MNRSLYLLRICQHSMRYLKDDPDFIPGREDWQPPFNEPFRPITLKRAIENHLDDQQGFSVILACSTWEEGETYSGFSDVSSWEGAVLHVAKQMRDDNELSISQDAELRVIDVIEGHECNTVSGFDRTTAVSFNEKMEPYLTVQNQI